MTPGKWLKLGEAAHTLGVSEITLRRRLRAGSLAYEFRSGKYFVFVPNGADANLGAEQQPALNGRMRHQPRPGFHPPSSSLPLGRALASQDLVYPGSKESAEIPAPIGDGPSHEQIIAILKIELREKEKEIQELRRALTDQETLNDALEAALAEMTETTESSGR
jgi:hypothetical protein